MLATQDLGKCDPAWQGGWVDSEMTEAVLLDVFAEDAPKNGSTTWLGLIVQWLERKPLSAADEALLDLVKRAAYRTGTPLLQASSREDLRERVERAVEQPDFFRFNTEAMKRLTLHVMASTAGRSEPTAEMVHVLGDRPARIVARTGPLTAAVASVAAQLLASHGPDALVTQSRQLEQEHLRFFARPGVHSAIKRAIFEGLCSTASLLGIVQALFNGKKIDPWLALALAETYHAGLYEYLRLLESLPVHVPESIIPLADRLDVQALQREVQEAEGAGKRSRAQPPRRAKAFIFAKPAMIREGSVVRAAGGGKDGRPGVYSTAVSAGGVSMASVAILVTVEQIMAAIQSLPVRERLQLIDSLNKDAGPPAAAEPKSIGRLEPADFMGFLADDPELADEIERIGTVERERDHMRAWDDVESRP